MVFGEKNALGTLALENIKNPEKCQIRDTVIFQGVHTVINFEMPRSVDSYIHRVGRTARAGCGGRSVTLIGERYSLMLV